MATSFSAVVARQGADKSYAVAQETLTREALPHAEGNVRVAVQFSSLNYKDALAVTGRGKIVRRFPMALGIDLAGTVIDPGATSLQKGEPVVAVGQGLGELFWGGYSQEASVAPGALVRIPAPLDPLTAMQLGTAGYTAMLCVMALEHAGVKPGEREVVVTGATGGVGSVAVMLLARLGFAVAASTGRSENAALLERLGARRIVPRAELEAPVPPLGKETWAGAVDTVGGSTLANLIATTASFGAIAACGMAGGAELHTSVFPFILRNVALLGVNSTQSPRPLLEEAWARLARDVDLSHLGSLSRTEPMSRLKPLSEALLANQLTGRTVIDVAR